MLDAGNDLFDRHGSEFVPSGRHPSQDFPHQFGPAADEDHFRVLQDDYSKVRHVTCRHGDCTSDYCQRIKKVNGKDVTYCRFAEQLALKTRPGLGTDANLLVPCPSL